MEQIGEMLASLNRQRPGAAGKREVFDACVRGMTGVLDAGSVYRNAQEVGELQGADVGSVGVEIRQDDGRARIVSTFEGSPAERAGLNSGDVLLTVNDDALNEMPLQILSAGSAASPARPFASGLRAKGPERNWRLR